MRFRHRAASLFCAVATASVVVPGAGLASAATTANLVVNSDFETGTSSWYAEKGTSLSRVAGYGGGSSARVTAATAGNAVLNDGPDTVTATQKGATYTASAYVRTAKAGVPVSLRLSEYTGTAVYGRAAADLTLTDTAWHKVTVTYVAKTAGSRLGVSVSGNQFAQGRSFDVDKVTLTVKPAVTAVATPTITSFTAAPTATQVALSWAATDATRYELYRSGATAPVYAGTATAHTFAAAAGTSYTFTLKAFSADGQVATSAPKTVTTPAAQKSNWARVYRNDFVDMRNVNAFQSGADANDAIKVTDSTNSQLQKPVVRSNTEIMADPSASDGKALGVWTRKANYTTSSGTKYGWANGRMSLGGQFHALPVRISTRLKMTASAGAKSAVMWWPEGGGWPWEVDFAETFGGKTTTDYWGSRQNVAQRWHADLNGDGNATEQLFHDDKVDATKYHVYDLVITADRMWIEIDGVKTFETTDKRFIPKGKGFFSIGKALTSSRELAARTQDAVIVDWVEIYKPAV